MPTETPPLAGRHPIRPPDPTAYHFDQALLPVCWTVCGVRLRPFSIGHYVLLKNVGNPMLDQEEPELPDDDKICWFLQTLLICASDYKSNMAMLEDPDSHRETMDKLVDNLLANMKADPNWNLFEHLRNFNRYVNWYMDVPIYFKEREGSKGLPSGIDWIQNLFMVMLKAGYSEDEILDMNFKKLLYLWCSHAESEGAIKVIHRQGLEQLARAKGLIH
jgi:hypothetical protein